MLTEMPKCRVSMDNVSAIASSAHLLAPYGPMIGSTRRPWMLETKTSRPDPRSRIAGSTACVTRSAPRVLSW
jgi:hypothetical protein